MFSFSEQCLSCCSVLFSPGLHLVTAGAELSLDGVTGSEWSISMRKCLEEV